MTAEVGVCGEYGEKSVDDVPKSQPPSEGMGKRKGRKQCHALKRPRLQEKLADRFDCPFCNDHKTVQCKSKEGVCRIACSSCAAHFEMTISDVGWRQSAGTLNF